MTSGHRVGVLAAALLILYLPRRLVRSIAWLLFVAALVFG